MRIHTTTLMSALTAAAALLFAGSVGAQTCFNINGHGVIPVEILGSGSFDVSNIDQSSLSFGGLTVRVRGNEGLTNSDSALDHFQDNADNWNAGNDTAMLTGTLLDGTAIEGSDSICVVPEP